MVFKNFLTYYQLICILFIDSTYDLGEVSIIFLSKQSKKRDMTAFLEELKELLGKEDFNIDKNRQG